MLVGVRGAITVPSNQPDAIRAAVQELIDRLVHDNHISAHDILTTFFSVTPDLTALNPAKAVREVRPDWNNVPMLCMQEPLIDGMMPRCIRVLIQWQPHTPNPRIIPVYLGDAAHLRPDLK